MTPATCGGSATTGSPRRRSTTTRPSSGQRRARRTRRAPALRAPLPLRPTQPRSRLLAGPRPTRPAALALARRPPDCPRQAWPVVHTVLSDAGLKSVSCAEAEKMAKQGWTLVDVRLSGDFDKARCVGGAPTAAAAARAAVCTQRRRRRGAWRAAPGRPLAHSSRPVGAACIAARPCIAAAWRATRGAQSAGRNDRCFGTCACVQTIACARTHTACARTHRAGARRGRRQRAAVPIRRGPGARGPRGGAFALSAARRVRRPAPRGCRRRPPATWGPNAAARPDAPADIERARSRACRRARRVRGTTSSGWPWRRSR
jgi:hypothetical protein